MDMFVVMACKLFGTACVEGAFYYVQAHLLPMPRRRLFYAIVYLLCALRLWLVVVGLSPALRMLFLTLSFALPIPFYSGRLWHRLLAASLAMCILTLGEIMLSGIWVLALGMEIGSYDAIQDHFVWYFTTMALDFAFVLYAGKRVIGPFRRFVSRFDGAVDASLAGFIGLQLVLLAILMSMFFDEIPGSAGFAGAIVVLGVVAAAVDIALFTAMGRARRMARRAERDRILQEELDGYLFKCESLSRHAVEVARVRHDARNHLYVIQGLIERNEVDAARAYVGECLAAAGASEGSASGAEAAAQAEGGAR